MKRVLIISIAGASGANPHPLQLFTDGLNTSTDRFDYAMIQRLVFKIEDAQFGITYEGRELHEEFGAIHLRNHHKYPDFANALRLYCDVHKLHLINRNDACLPYFGKLSQGALLALNGLPTPDLTTAYGNRTLLAELERMSWHYPIVVKHNEGMRGVDNYLVKDRDELRTVLAQDKQGFVAQPFIKNGGELRVLTFGASLPPLVFQKTAVEGQYLNNTSQGGIAKLIAPGDVPPAIINDALKAATLMGREIAGVDVLLAADGSYLILEVNSTPSIASGVYLDEKQKLYAKYFDVLDDASL